mmetsp:Transcript_76419/g.183058  ORF Transcript_76419/g.183058 Transcript_76419/m.183058 type:complete len:201 (+) Transcript_76419:2142-2744(+)
MKKECSVTSSVKRIILWAKYMMRFIVGCKLRSSLGCTGVPPVSERHPFFSSFAWNCQPSGPLDRCCVYHVYSALASTKSPIKRATAITCLPLKLLEERESAKDSLLSIRLFQLISTMQKQHIINPARGAKRSMAGFRSPAKSRQSLASRCSAFVKLLAAAVSETACTAVAAVVVKRLCGAREAGPKGDGTVRCRLPCSHF